MMASLSISISMWSGWTPITHQWDCITSENINWSQFLRKVKVVAVLMIWREIPMCWEGSSPAKERDRERRKELNSRGMVLDAEGNETTRSQLQKRIHERKSAEQREVEAKAVLITWREIPMCWEGSSPAVQPSERSVLRMGWALHQSRILLATLGFALHYSFVFDHT